MSFKNPEFFAALGEKMGTPISRIDRVGDLPAGCSGASVMPVIIQTASGEAHFAVIKTSPKEADIEADLDGAAELQDSWLKEHIPRFSHRVRLESGQTYAVSAYAGGRRPRADSLLDVMQKNQSEAAVTLKQVVDLHIAMTLEQGLGEPRKPREVMRGMLHAEMREKLDVFHWTRFGVEPDRPRMLVGERLRPNPLYALRRPDLWRGGIPWLVRWEPTHGDLNAENILLCGDVKPVFIDFEKVRLGIPLYDLAFLACKLVEKLYLDQSAAVAPEFNLAEMLARPESFVVGAGTAMLSPVVEEILVPINNLVDPARAKGMLAPEWMRSLASLALSTAALVRAFYELRCAGDRTRSSGDASARHLRNGQFYFAMSGIALHQNDLTIPADENSDHFELRGRSPLAPGTDPDPLDDALAVEVRCDELPRRSFATRLMWLVPMPTPIDGPELPGWRRLEKVEQYSYFSKMNIRTNEAMAQLTGDALVWAPLPGGEKLPLVFELQEAVLPGPRLMEFKRGPEDLRLAKVDLVPVRGGSMAWLGFRFEGGPCSLEQYLTWLSNRSFGKLSITFNRGSNGARARMGRIMDELCSALRDRREPEVLAPGNAPAGEQPYFFQLLLCPRWPFHGSEAVTDRAWGLLCSGSRPKKEYPKERPERLASWEKFAHQTASLYGAVNKGVTVLAHGGVQFNAQTKPTSFGEAEYLLWIIARTMRELRCSNEQASALAAPMESARRRFFNMIWEALAHE